jgi:hypothetical protein
LAARHTHSTIGRPAISRNTFLVSLVEPSRAGITPAMRTVLMLASLQQRAISPHPQQLQQAGQIVSRWARLTAPESGTPHV